MKRCNWAEENIFENMGANLPSLRSTVQFICFKDRIQNRVAPKNCCCSPEVCSSLTKKSRKRRYGGRYLQLHCGVSVVGVSGSTWPSIEDARGHLQRCVCGWIVKHGKWSPNTSKPNSEMYVYYTSNKIFKQDPCLVMVQQQP